MPKMTSAQYEKKVKDFLKGFVKKGGTVFLCTHVLEIAEEICTSVGILDRGKLIYEGSIKDVKKKRKSLENFFLKLVER